MHDFKSLIKYFRITKMEINIKNMKFKLYLCFPMIS